MQGILARDPRKGIQSVLRSKILPNVTMELRGADFEITSNLLHKILTAKSTTGPLPLSPNIQIPTSNRSCSHAHTSNRDRVHG